MPKPRKIKSTRSARRPRRRSEPDDSPGQALESGEPAVTGRTHGHVLEASEIAEAERLRTAKAPPDTDHFESGRQDAIP